MPSMRRSIRAYVDDVKDLRGSRSRVRCHDVGRRKSMPRLSGAVIINEAFKWWCRDPLPD